MWAWKHTHSEDGTTEYRQLKGDLVMDDVDFGYTDDKMVLHNIDLYAKPGQKIAFVGSTGAGKTTITNLINRFYDIQDGKIRYDGININKIKKADLRRSLGIVLQETHLFTDTVMENIRYGRLDATDEEVIAAAKAAHAHHFIETLPGGYNMELNEDASNVSQGQKQLLTIARAILADNPILILDEATSGLDPVFRDEILDILREYTEDEEHTILMSSHITSDLDKISDYIAFIHDGELLFTKTYDELQENYGVLNCGQRIFDALNREDIEAYRKDSYGYRVLVNNKQGIRKVFSDLEIEQATIEDVMLYCVRGEKVA